MEPLAAVVPLARADPELGKLVLVDIANRGDRVILQSVWTVDRRGRRVTEIEVIPSEAALLARFTELAPLLYRALAAIGRRSVPQGPAASRVAAGMRPLR
jgi:hypothetical protein